MATHTAALFAAIGEEKTKKFYLDLKANECKPMPGNLICAKMVAQGEVLVCLVDTDDANEMLIDKQPVKIVYPDQNGIGTFVLPNSISLVK